MTADVDPVIEEGTCMNRLRNRLGEDRGDVPGWVLVAVMTAGLVTALWFVADEQLTALLNRAITSISEP